MACSPAALPLVGARQLRPALCKSSAPRRKPLVLRRPPSRSEPWDGPSPVWWASPPKPIKTQSSLSGAAIGQSGCVPAEVWSLPPPPPEFGGEQPGVVLSPAALGPGVSERGSSPPAGSALPPLRVEDPSLPPASLKPWEVAEEEPWSKSQMGWRAAHKIRVLQK